MTRDPNLRGRPPSSGEADAAFLEPAPEIHRQEPPAALHGRLLQVSRMATIGEMAAGVAHELNQPLTAIANYAHAARRLLDRPAADPAALCEALTEISAQAARAADIIRRLRALTGGQPTLRVVADINEVVREMVDLVTSDALLHGVQLTLDLADNLPQVTVDSAQIQHVILTFVRNSLEALAGGPPHAGQLVIKTSRTAAGDVELTVIDNGPGLAAEAAHRLFHPFFSTKESGTGLGLAISNSIARAHGGSVGYRPNQHGGACFFIQLPCPSAT